MRITKKDLNVLIERLNRKGKGEFMLDISNGGYRLERKDGNGAENISIRCTAKELYNVMQAILNVL